MEYALLKYRLLAKFHIYTQNVNNKNFVENYLPFYQEIAKVNITKQIEKCTFVDKNKLYINSSKTIEKNTAVNFTYSSKIIFFDDSVICYDNLERDIPSYISKRFDKFAFLINDIRQLCLEKLKKKDDNKLGDVFHILYFTKHFTCSLYSIELMLEHLPTALYCTHKEYTEIFNKNYRQWYRISLSAKVEQFYLMQSSDDFIKLEFLDWNERKELYMFFNACFETFNRLYVRLYIEAKITKTLHKKFEILYILMS